MPARPLIRWLALCALVIVVALAGVLVLSGQSIGASPGTTRRVSVRSNGNQGNGSSAFPATSSAGVFVHDRAEADTATPTPTPCIPPANDDFSNSAGIGAVPFGANLSTACATSQVHEPQPCGIIASTVWYSYTPSESEILQADTMGSDYDTALAVYTGSDLESLSSVACDDDSGPGLTSLITFAAEGGTTYHFQVGGFAGSRGGLSFALAPAVPTPTPTYTPTPTATWTPSDPTITPTPTSCRPVAIPHIDKTVNGQQGPITVTLGDSVTFGWSTWCNTLCSGWVDDYTYDALDGSCDYGWCERTAVVTLLTPGPVTNTVSFYACTVGLCGGCNYALDYVKINVVTPAAVGGIAEIPPLAGSSAKEAAAPAEESGWSAGTLAGLASLGAVAAAIIAASGWYLRRRWLR
jgi:hypothetical protein